MSTEGYNGWKNYPTWAVNLWLQNDEGLYQAAMDRTDDAILGAKDARKRMEHPYWTEEESFRFSVADALKDLVEELAEETLSASETGFVSDLLGYALGKVEWNEIADAWIETVREAREYA